MELARSTWWGRCHLGTHKNLSWHWGQEQGPSPSHSLQADLLRAGNEQHRRNLEGAGVGLVSPWDKEPVPGVGTGTKPIMFTPG